MLKKILISLVIAILISSGLTVYSALDSKNELEEELLRFHILANSNEDMDQRVKLQIRDKIAELLSFDMQQTRDDTVHEIDRRFFEIEEAANNIIVINGLSYTARAEIKEVFFPTREYGSLTVPSGKYLSLVLSLGEARGENWWCVMYPPLCYSEGEVVNEAELQGFFIEHFSKRTSDLVVEPRTVYKLKLLELIEGLKKGE